MVQMPESLPRELQILRLKHIPKDCRIYCPRSHLDDLNFNVGPWGQGEREIVCSSMLKDIGVVRQRRDNYPSRKSAGNDLIVGRKVVPDDRCDTVHSLYTGGVEFVLINRDVDKNGRIGPDSVRVCSSGHIHNSLGGRGEPVGRRVCNDIRSWRERDGEGGNPLCPSNVHRDVQGYRLIVCGRCLSLYGQSAVTEGRCSYDRVGDHGYYEDNWNEKQKCANPPVPLAPCQRIRPVPEARRFSAIKGKENNSSRGELPTLGSFVGPLLALVVFYAESAEIFSRGLSLTPRSSLM